MAHGVAIREPLVNPRPYGTADAAFGLDVLGAVCRSDPRSNLVLSPSSLASGLGMAYLGARGGPARAVAGAVRPPSPGRPAPRPSDEPIKTTHTGNDQVYNHITENNSIDPY